MNFRQLCQVAAGRFFDSYFGGAITRYVGGDFVSLTIEQANEGLRRGDLAPLPMSAGAGFVADGVSTTATLPNTTTQVVLQGATGAVTYRIDDSYRDGRLFTIDATTGLVSWIGTPPTLGTMGSSFATDTYKIRVIADDAGNPLQPQAFDVTVTFAG